MICWEQKMVVEHANWWERFDNNLNSLAVILTGRNNDLIRQIKLIWGLIKYNLSIKNQQH